ALSGCPFLSESFGIRRPVFDERGHRSTFHFDGVERQRSPHFAGLLARWFREGEWKSGRRTTTSSRGVGNFGGLMACDQRRAGRRRAGPSGHAQRAAEHAAGTI